ncbi:MAG: alpha/beta hydrolase [Balneolaceae bacterium]|nr:alpha/beta hydrolase [Balneolaceae bacterium]
MFGNTKFDVKQSEGYQFIEITSDNPSAPNLVFLHGMFGGLSNFDALMDRLEDVNIFVPDIPLYEMKRSDLSISYLAEWVRDFINAQGIQNPILLGNSLGGHIALQYALSYPDDVAGLILTGSSGLLENDFGNTSPRRKDPEYIRKQANLTFYEDLADDTLVEEIMEVTESPIKLLKLLTIARSTQKHNMEEKLPNIKVPVLLVWGKEDIITPPEVADTFFEKIPKAELHWIERCGHAPMMERPDEFVEYAKPFLEKFLSSNSNEKEIQSI